ncbi:MAG: TIGR04283 family arsenosugar biosynthesis glycosyltransferase [Planctomycetales bacterium]|nr:TIGR04283 family arsenosugar biosynthesis glycosyltransferase [Planctomycetales bacterium]
MISVIIPTLNEGVSIARLIAETRRIGVCEIIVVDGGSTDETLVEAALADRVISSPRGRATQQNLGASASRGEVLLFLHADCQLPVGAFDAIRGGLDDARTVGGCFGQTIAAEGRLYRWLEWGNGLRVRWLRMAYGDQAIFIRKSVFEQLGGFPEVKLMEDVLLMKRLRHAGRFILLPDRITVSARRWQRHGPIRQTLRNWLLLTLALCGVSPNNLARFYPNTR